MKKTILLLSMIMVIAVVGCRRQNADTDIDLIRNPKSAQGYDDTEKMPVISFDQELHDFGRLSAGESISYSFHFKNTGNADLITFKSAGKSGTQFQEVTVVSNAQPARTKLKITAQVGH